MSDDFHIHVNGMLDMDGKEYSKETVKQALERSVEMSSYISDGNLVHKGRIISLATIEAALKNHNNFEKQLTPKPYRFKAGDVVEYGTQKNQAIIVRVVAGLRAISVFTGREMVAMLGQYDFEAAGMVKIGVLSDYLPKDE